MWKTKTIVLLLLFITFNNTLICEAALAGQRKENEIDVLLKNDAKTYANFCTAYYLLLESRWEDAAKFFHKVLETSPQASKIHNYLATCYFQLNEKEKALSHAEKVARLSPDDFGVHYTLGNIYENEGDEIKAIGALERANNCATEHIGKVYLSDMLHRLAGLYLKNKSPGKAAIIYKKILEDKLTDGPSKVLFKLGQIYFEEEKFEEAKNEFVKAREHGPNFESLNFFLAICYEEIGEFENAIAELVSFIEDQPDVWRVRVSLSNLYEKIEKFDLVEVEREKVVNILKKNIDEGTSNLRERLVLGQIFQMRGENIQAIEVLRAAVSKDTSSDDIGMLTEMHLLMSNIFYEMNDDDNVVKILRKVLQIDPDCHQASNFLGFFFVENGENYEEALSLIENALSFEPENGAYLDSLGWAYYKIANEHDDGKVMLALQKLIEASKYAEDPEILEHIGDVNYSLGMWDEAQKRWEGALNKWQEAINDGPQYQKKLTSREIKTIKMVKKKLERLHSLKMLEGPTKRLKGKKEFQGTN